MSSQVLRSVQKTAALVGQAVEQQARASGAFVWQAGVGYQYQPVQGGVQGREEGSRRGQFTPGLGWEWDTKTSPGSQ